MRLTVLKSKLHLATVTGCALNYHGSLTIDPVLMEAVGLYPYEAILIGNVALYGATSGEAYFRGIAGEEVALVTITASTGSTPQRVGAKMLVYSDGRTVGTIGGGCYENDAFWKAREAIKARRPLNVKYELNDDFAQETGLVCGGQMEVFIEPVEPSPDVYIFGAGSRAPLGIQVTLKLDHREFDCFQTKAIAISRGQCVMPALQ